MTCRAGYQMSCDASVPFRTCLATHLSHNRSIIVHGSVPSGATRFHINLMNSGTKDVYLHFNPRFKEGVVVRNCKHGGTWSIEERDLPCMPFGAGQCFQLEIKNEGNAFGIYSNGKKICSFSRHNQDDAIDTLEIEGDVCLSCVEY
uniref:Galectin n=1 Tax=Dyscophus guineti TaxID=111069 RepID=A0AAU7BBU7_9NEOB